MGIRFSEPIGTLSGVVLGSLFPGTDIIGSPDSLFPVMKIYHYHDRLHSLFFLIVGFSVFYLIHKGFGIGFFIGYGLHLAEDAIKGSDLSFLWYPWRRKPKTQKCINE